MCNTENGKTYYKRSIRLVTSFYKFALVKTQNSNRLKNDHNTYIQKKRATQISVILEMRYYNARPHKIYEKHNRSKIKT